MRRRPRLILALLVVLLVASVITLVLVRLNDRTFPPAIPSGELTFTINARGHWDLAAYTVEDGLVILTPDDGFQDYFASWDFASERINFLSNRTPDGELGPTEIHPDGSNLRSLDILSAVATLFFENRLDWDPVYAPDGTIAWSSLRDINLELYIRTSSGEAKRITQGGARDWFAAWSPDGRVIAFASDRADGNEDIYLIDPGGAETIAVTTHPADDTHPMWSLDGTQLAFVSERDGELKDGILNFYVIDVEAALGGEGDASVRPLDPDVPFEGDPRYSADGKQVAVMARQDGKWVVRVMDIADNGDIIRESAQTIETDGDLMFPVWRPSKEIVNDE